MYILIIQQKILIWTIFRTCIKVHWYFKCNYRKNKIKHSYTSN